MKHNDYLDALVSHAKDTGITVEDRPFTELERDGVTHKECICISRPSGTFGEELDSPGVGVVKHLFTADCYVEGRENTADRRAMDILETLASVLRKSAIDGRPIELSGWEKRESETELSALYTLSFSVIIADEF